MIFILKERIWMEFLVLLLKLGNGIPKRFFLFVFLNLFLIGGWLLYNIVLASAIQQCESAVSLHIYPPSWTYPLSYPVPLGCHRVPRSTPCVKQQLPISYLFCLWWCVWFSVTLSIHPTLSFPCCVQSLFLCLHVYSCPANRFINTIFLDSIYMC